ncbi:MAG: hypothetical protein Q4C47_03390 [Planctomycetia bacterium]|nr:hypothetical protein [Planctomycetia bacterium]
MAGIHPTSSEGLYTDICTDVDDERRELWPDRSREIRTGPREMVAWTKRNGRVGGKPLFGGIGLDGFRESW